MSTRLCCQRPCRPLLPHPIQPVMSQLLSLRALSAGSDPLLVFVECCRQEGQGYLSIYIPGCNGLVLPADVFTPLQAQGQILLMSGVSELSLFRHTLPNWARLATSCLQEANQVLLPVFWLFILCEARTLLETGSALA